MNEIENKKIGCTRNDLMNIFLLWSIIRCMRKFLVTYMTKKNSNFFWTLNCKHAFELKPLPKCCMHCHTCICIARDRVHRFPFNCCFVPFRNFCCALHKHTAHELMWKHKQAKMQQQRRHEKKNR